MNISANKLGGLEKEILTANFAKKFARYAKV
jgi:hypothetical protein